MENTLKTRIDEKNYYAMKNGSFSQVSFHSKKRIAVRTYLFTIISLFLLVFDIPLVNLSIYHIYAFFSIFYILAKKRYIEKSFLIVFGVYLILLVQLLFLNLFQGQNLEKIYNELIKIFELIFIYYAFAIYFKGKNFNMKNIITSLIFVACLQAIFVFLTMLIPPFREGLLEYLFNNIEFGRLDLLSYRIYGIGRSFTYTLPLFQSVIAVFCLKRFYDKNILYLILSAVLFVSAVVNARTALVIYGLGCVFVIIFSLIKYRKNYAFFKTIFLIVAGIIFIIAIWPILGKVSPSTFEWVNKGIEEIIKFLQGESTGFFVNINKGDAGGHTLSPLQIIFGTGQSVMGNPYLGYASDKGYINYMYLGGIFYSIILYSLYCFILFKLYRHSNSGKIYSLILFATFAIANYKGLAFGSNELVNLTLLLYFATVIKHNDKEVNYA